MKKNLKRIVAVVVLAAFVFFAVFGMAGLVISSHHDCTGAHCHTCARIAAIEKTVGALSLAIALIICSLPAFKELKMLTAKTPPAFEFFTTVSLKVKLNN